MPKIAKSLSDTQLKNAKPKGKDYKLSDGEGFKSLLLNNINPISEKRAKKISETIAISDVIEE